MKWKDGVEGSESISFVGVTPLKEANHNSNGSIQNGVGSKSTQPSSSRSRERTLSTNSSESEINSATIRRGPKGNQAQISTISGNRVDAVDGGLPSFSTLLDLEKSRRPSDTDFFRKKEGRRAEWWLVLISSSLGLGNIWRFPNVAHQYGGGTFLFAYLLVVLFIAFPICFLELSLGQFSSGQIGSAWKCLPVLKGIVPGQKIVTVYLAVLLSHVTSHSMSFMYKAFRGPLLNQSIYVENNTQDLLNEMLKEGPWRLPENGTARPALIDGLNGTVAACEILVWAIVFITFLVPRTMKKAFLVTSVFPPLCFASCLVYSVLQTGAKDGIIFFFSPKWDDLKSVEVWYAAAQQAFFSLGIGFGHLVIFSQFNDFKHRVFRDTIFICLVDTLINIGSGCILFSVLGYVFNISGIEPMEGFRNYTAQAGYGLSFQSYSMILSSIETPILVEFCSVIFFFAITLLGLGNLVPVVDSMFDKPEEGRPNAKRKRFFFCFLVCVLCCGVGVFMATKYGPQVIISIDQYGVGGPIIVFAIVECLGLMYGYGAKNITDDLGFMLDRKFYIQWRIIWAFVAPLGLTIVFIYWHVLDVQSEKGSIWLTINWILMLFAIIQIPIWIFFTYRSSDEYGFRRKMASLVKVEYDWGPSDPIHLHKWRKRKEIKQVSRSSSRSSTFRKGNDNPGFQDDVDSVSIVDVAEDTTM